MLRIGTDCSGIEAPIQALMQMNIPFIHVFSSDIDKYCIKSNQIKQNEMKLHKMICHDMKRKMMRKEMH